MDRGWTLVKPVSIPGMAQSSFVVGSLRGHSEEDQGKASPRRRDGEGSVSIFPRVARVARCLGRCAQCRVKRPALDTYRRREGSARTRDQRAQFEGRDAVNAKRASNDRATLRIELAPADAEVLEDLADAWSNEHERVFSASDVAAELVRRAVKRRVRRRARAAARGA